MCLRSSTSSRDPTGGFFVICSYKCLADISFRVREEHVSSLFPMIGTAPRMSHHLFSELNTLHVNIP